MILTEQYQYVMVICDGSDWYILGGELMGMITVLYELIDKQNEIILELRETNLHLQSMTGEELTKEDMDNGD